MKKIVVLFFIIIPVIAAASEKNITLQNISGTLWEWHTKGTDNWAFLTFRFMPDGTLKLESSSYGFDETGGVLEGNYSIENDNLVLNYKLYSSYDKVNDSNYKPEVFKKKGIIQKSADAVQYDTLVRFDNVTIICRESELKEGLRRKLEGVEVITTGGKTGVVTRNAKIRSKPDVKASFINFGVEVGTEGLAYCPEGKELKILARTESRVQVDKWNNHWYYVELTSAGEFGKRYGWIYGEFIKFK